MNRLRLPFGGLYWRLTVSYFLVALVAVLTFTAYASLNPLIASAGGSAARSPLDELGSKNNVPELASYLEQGPADRDALNGWAWRLLVGVRIPLGAVTLAQILDADGQPLVSNAPAGTLTQALVSTSQAQAVLHAAMAGDQRPEDLRRTLADGQTVLAVPIVTDKREPRVVGVFFAVCTGNSFPATKVFSYWLAPYLAQQPPNLDALRGWLWAEARSSGLPSESIAVNAGALLVQVLDADGQPLAAAAAPGVLAEPILARPESRAAIHGALAGRAQATAPFATDSRSQVVEAMPVRAYDGHIIGALVVAYDPTSGAPDLQSVLSDFISRLSTGFLFLLLATLVGTLAGALTALSLRRRLRRITRASDAWSRGELDVAVRDRSRDEVGQLARQLDRMAERIRALLVARQELAVVDERNRLARELHDSVKQHVFAGALLVRAARTLAERDPDAAAGHLAEAEALAAQTQQELTTLIRALRPAALADRGLAATLREYAEDWSRRTGIAAEARLQGERATPLDVEDALFRVAQEALANVARHSGARTAQVRLAWEDGAVRLTVDDDGRGFDPGRAAGAGLGLASMRERVEALGGALTVASSPAGTSVEARVPLSSAEVAPDVAGPSYARKGAEVAHE